jgi:hypothetical protein
VQYSFASVSFDVKAKTIKVSFKAAGKGKAVKLQFAPAGNNVSNIYLKRDLFLSNATS